MPLQNEHAARLKNPNLYKRFRRQNNKFKPGIHAIFGVRKDNEKVELQSIRFDAKKYTVQQAKKWLKDNDFKPISFEPAKGAKMRPQTQTQTGEDIYLSFGPRVREINEDGSIKFRLTDKNIDRYGEVVLPKGAQLKNFKDNPIVLWAHNYAPTDKTPIGRIDMGSFEITDDYVDANIIFDMEDEFAVKIYNKVSNNFLNAGSIGFRPITISKEPVAPKQKGVTHEKWELLEFSIVPVPALPSALAQREYRDFLKECDDCGHPVTQDLVKFYFEEKAGAVLSKKNRTLIKEAVESMEPAVTALRELLTATEEPEKDYETFDTDAYLESLRYLNLRRGLKNIKRHQMSKRKQEQENGQTGSQ